MCIDQSARVMDKLYLEATYQTPEITLDSNSNTFKIEGHSLPEDVVEFYTPILNWLDQYIQNPLANTEFTFKLSYYNSASSKILLDIVNKLNAIHKAGQKVKILWHYAEDDEDMQQAGEELEEWVDVPFEYISF